MLPVRLLETLTPHARVATALLPFVVALIFRVIWGKGRLSSVVVTLGTVWFAINVLLAPYSVGMRQDLMKLQQAFR